ncbi:UNVERIFIED_CONTAM: hypothetical protein Sradi_2076200 [Sesamum radiatum]|uniref:Uncharacterized protein n=1 Tax=Sesamum radiatum TaxID=300843 RepID=A0AAW2TI60_SESRA
MGEGLRFPDGYASNIARCVDVANFRLHGMKSHNCHVFIQKLILVAFHELLPEFIWSALMEISLLFQVLCSTTLDVKKVQELAENVAVIMCDLEKYFLQLSSTRWSTSLFTGHTRHVWEDTCIIGGYTHLRAREVEPPKVNTDNQTYNLHDSNDLILFADISKAIQHGAETSPPHDEDEEDKEQDEEDGLE